MSDPPALPGAAVPEPRGVAAVPSRPERTAVVVAVLTYRRPNDLAALLPELRKQVDDVVGRCRASVLVVDNDAVGSASGIVAGAADPGVRYVVEPTPGIAAARNRALDEAADADILVFIDDDELPSEHWLANLLDTAQRTGASAVAGAVASEFDGELEPWLAAGEFFRRRRLPTGTPIDVAATNNLLLDLRVVRRLGLRFDLALGLTGGEDTLFTRTLHAHGERMAWCNEALVTDRVPRARMTRTWVLARAFSSGNARTEVALRLARGPQARLAAYADALRAGLPRLVGGGLRFVLGLALRSHRHQAKGLRTAYRGAGMLAGVVGHRFEEYARVDVAAAPPREGAPPPGPTHRAAS
ncbi:glycosyltransferase family 2 protein [uncultured Jatrophihabitans sp.]|uniref:glycosyltransferase family 2 protein n=1 Tax=uncultured Jatrophihabitans sp. TaxID=1610747 RepID=UPI0035CB8292